MNYKCVKEFGIPTTNEDGDICENDEFMTVKENSLWEIRKDSYKMIGGEVRLEDECGNWVEICNETFERYFEAI